MIDFHSHVLFRIDDGAKDIETSIAMLRQAYDSGTDVILLTPHYYPREESGTDNFLDRRKRRFDELCRACYGLDVPELVLACEVNIHTNFSSFERLRELCIGDTDYMLVEMPQTGKWEDWMYECIYSLKLKGIKPIIAHIDRYLNHPEQDLAALDELRPLYQVNSDSILTYAGRKKVLELFYKNRVHVLGSDMHGLESRKNTLPEAYIQLEKRFGEDFISYIEKNGDLILLNREVERDHVFPSVRKSKLIF